MPARRRSALPIAVTLLLPLAVAAPAPAQQSGAASGPPTPIEQAVIEYRCSTSRAPGEPEAVHQACLEAQLLTLRDDFGRDLARVSPAERKTMDAACETVRTLRGRDGYVACVSDQLTALRNRRSRGAPPQDQPAPQAGETGVAAPPPDAAVPVAVYTGSWTVLWIGVAAVVLLGGAGAFFWAMSRRAPAMCRVCGRNPAEHGDLCPACRHEAAEALRRAAAERAEQERAREEETRRQRERIEETQRMRRLEVEAGELRRRELARLEQQAREIEEARQRERDEEARLRRQAADPQHAEMFDPRAVLGVGPQATAAEITAAYEAAKAKFAPDLVAHLGTELQEHFRKKTEAVERAYQMLAT
jgi:hypothetical protein